MAGRRTRSMTGSDLSKTTPVRAAAVATLLQRECSVLMELYRQRESLSADVEDGRLVSVVPPSSQLDTKDRLWRLYSALLQCRTLLDRAIAKEDEELGGGEKGEYENQREMVKNRLSFLIRDTEELHRAAGGATMAAPDLKGLELNGSTALFELKLWVYQVYKEVDHWAKTAAAILKEPLPDTPKEPRRRKRHARGTQR